MMLYIFNNYFFDDSGFSKRCKREIDILSQTEDISLLCRKGKNNNAYYENKYRRISLSFFDPKMPLLETPNKYKTGLYEIYRTVKLYKSLASILYKKITKNKNASITIYVVNSPMTLSVFCLCFAKIFRIKNTILEFHDLEPEMAMHMKKLDRKNLVVSIEYFLERFLCNVYNKIIVTNRIQKDILSKRTDTSKEKFFILPNTMQYAEYLDKVSETIHVKNINKNDFVVGYISTLSFDYTVKGICTLLEKISPFFSPYPNIKFIIIGDGEGIEKIKKIITDYSIGTNVLLTGKIKKVESVLKRVNVCIIPWENDMFTQTILPTKLFEYLAAKKPVIVPNFGEFTEIIKNNKNGLLYNTYTDLITKIIELKNNEQKAKKIAEAGYKTYLNHFDLIHYEKRYREFLHI
ncbi:MAG TPA: glycosyltransferase [Candidatus Saccharimonadales bacterium]|nr:glycosyltransferase [Candidatus Saccharimonadales bacterium]